MLYRSRSTYVLQGTAKKAKEEKAQGFGRKLDAEKIIGATNEPGFVFHVLYTLPMPILFGSSPAYMAKLPQSIVLNRRAVLPDQVERY